MAGRLQGETQKENSNWCDRSRVGVHRRDEVARPLSICQSLLSRRWSLNAACHSLQRLFTRPPLGNFLSLLPCPPPSPFCSSTGFFISTLQAAPFQSIISSTPTPALLEEVGEEGGQHAKRCGIYLSFLAPVAVFHKALWPFSFTPSSLIPLPSSRLLSLPSYLSGKKRATLVFQANLSPLWPFCHFCSFHFYPPARPAEVGKGTQDSRVTRDETKAHAQVSP